MGDEYGDDVCEQVARSFLATIQSYDKKTTANLTKHNISLSGDDPMDTRIEDACLACFTIDYAVQLMAGTDSKEKHKILDQFYILLVEWLNEIYGLDVNLLKQRLAEYMHAVKGQAKTNPNSTTDNLSQALLVNNDVAEVYSAHCSEDQVLVWYVRASHIYDSFVRDSLRIIYAFYQMEVDLNIQITLHETLLAEMQNSVPEKKPFWKRLW